MSTFPRITVVTPSFNQAQYLEQTIQSVLGQCYPNLEYFVFDGGSTDGSVDIIKRYEKQLAGWRSGPDGGQSIAINSAFASATGDILCWLNSDDFYFPGTLHRVAALLADGEARLVYGKCLFFWQDSNGCQMTDPPEFSRELLEIWDYIVQPSAFWTRSLWEKTGKLREDLHYAFDWDWWLRASRVGELVRCGDTFSAYRFHAAHKSSASTGNRRRDEILSVVNAHKSPETSALLHLADERRGALARYESLLGRLQGRGINGAHSIARFLCPELWEVPIGDKLERLRLCANLLS